MQSGEGGKASDPAQDKPYGCLGTQMEKVRARGSGDGEETTWPSSDLATGAETRALPPFPSVSMDQTSVCEGRWSPQRCGQPAQAGARCGAGLPPHKETAHLQGLQDGNRQSPGCRGGGYTGCKKGATESGVVVHSYSPNTGAAEIEGLPGVCG